MNYLPIVLFTLGIIVFIVAWRLGNPPKTSPELLAALKGIAGVKRDMGFLRTELQEAEARLDEHERRLAEQRSVPFKAEEQSVCEPEKAFLDIEEVPLAVTSIADRETPESHIFPDKYRQVMELYEQGWATLDIAAHLAISQDAVNMVLKTYPRGERR